MANRILGILVIAIFNVFVLGSSVGNFSLPSKTISISRSTSRSSTTTPAPSRYSENACGACGARVITISTWSWSQWIFPHTVGKVFVVIDDSTNSTRTSTSLETVAITAGSETLSASDWMVNGTFQPLKSRRTATMTHIIDQSTTLTYPSRLIRIGATEISWGGKVPISQGNESYCLDAETAPPFTMTTALPSIAPQAVDPNDPLGEYYKAMDWKGERILPPEEVGTYFGPMASMVYSSCKGPGTLPASWATSALFLLETSTQRINTKAEASSPSPEPTSQTFSPSKAQSAHLQVTEEPSTTVPKVRQSTMLGSATAAVSLETSHITISSTHPGTVATWAEAAQNLLSTPATSQDSKPSLTTVNGDAVASVVASILGMTKTKKVQAHEEISIAQEPSSPATTHASEKIQSANGSDEQSDDVMDEPTSSADGTAPAHDSVFEPQVSKSGVATGFGTSQASNGKSTQTASTKTTGASKPDAMPNSASEHQPIEPTHSPSSPSVEEAPIQDSLSAPHIPDSAVLPILIASQALDYRSSQTPTTSPRSKTSGMSDILAISSGHSGNVPHSSNPAAQSTGTSAGSSKTTSQTPVVPSSSTSPNDSNAGAISQPSTESGSASSVGEALTTSAGDTAQTPSVSSVTPTRLTETALIDTSTTLQTSTAPSSPLVQSNTATALKGGIDLFLPAWLALSFFIIRTAV